MFGRAHARKFPHARPTAASGRAGTNLQEIPKMPRDVPLLEDSEVPVRRSGARRLAPVASPAKVWATAQRAFRVEKNGQLALRARLLDVLEHLDRGHLLALMGGVAPAVWLDGHPDIVLLAGMLFTYGFVEIAGRHRDNANIVYFGLSSDGHRKLHEGRAWWNSLTWRERLKVRVFG
jgi:hypothetical protein